MQGFAATSEEELREADQPVETPYSDYGLRNLANNGLLVSYKGCQIRIRKARGVKPPAPTSGTQEAFYNQHFGYKSWWQRRLEFSDEWLDLGERLSR